MIKCRSVEWHCSQDMNRRGKEIERDAGKINEVMHSGKEKVQSRVVFLE